MKRILLFFLMAFISSPSFAQYLLPYTFTNNSIYSDDEIYIGLVGKFGNNVDVWMDLNDSSLIPMSAEQNTLDGPVWSTPADWKYPDIFTKLSDITDHTLQIPQGLYGSRIFISFQSPMYLHFHETGGYAGANLNASTDPNDGIRWEIVELTWGNSGLWTNSSRVDAYQYPVSVEVSGFTGGLIEPTYTESYLSAVGGNGTPTYGKIGELLPHEQILDQWDTSVAPEYLVAKVIKEHSIDGGYIIEQPSKVEAFPEDILDEYIDDIWTTYSNHDLVIDIGDRAVWTGRVTGEQFDFVDPADGSIATIYGKPGSFNAIEGSGFLASTPVDASVNQEKHDEDLMIQAQMAAAINRHAIYTEVIDGSVQFTHDASRYFIQAPYNEYVRFFHDEAISYDSKTYAFAYDDVGDHSSTLQCTFPTGVQVIIGGYDQYVEPAPAIAFLSISPYVREMEQGTELQFTAQAYDQYSAPFATNATWTTNGGSIDANGLYSATTLGTFTVTAQDGDISQSVDIRVTEIPGVTGCEADAPNGDFSYIAADDGEALSLTFIPSVAGTGNPVCLLYYTTDLNGNFTDARVTPNVPEQITAAAGDTVSFYYTYSLPSGGENNTAGTLQSFIVGDCSGTVGTNSSSGFANLSLYPNPTKRQASYLSGLTESVTVSIYTVEGKLISRHEVNNNAENFKIDTADFASGLYLVSVLSRDSGSAKVLKLLVK